MRQPQTINEVVMSAVQRFDGPCTFGYKKEGAWMEVPHAEVLRRIRAIALGLHQLGVGKSSLVVILAENSLEWILADLGVLASGAADVPIYHSMTAHQVEYIVRDSRPRVAFVSGAEQLTKLRHLRLGESVLSTIVVFDPHWTKKDDDSVLTLQELERLGEALDTREPALFDSLWQQVSADDLATLLYTSGTTGEPKGVLLSHGNITSNLLGTYEALGLEPQAEVGLTFLPFSHIFERTNLYGYVHAGIPLYLAESIDSVGQNLREVRPTMMTSVPRLFEKIYQRIVLKAATGSWLQSAVVQWSLRIGRSYAERCHAGRPVNLVLRLKYLFSYLLFFRKWKKGMGGRLRFLVSGGAPLSSDIAYLFLAARLPILQGYGLTETSPVITLNPPHANRVGTVGRPIPNVQIRISEDGEIWVKGPGVTSGYFGRPSENQSVFRDGWFATGDLGYLDADGYLVVTDRKKDLIKTSGGKYVAPQPIENRILASRFIRQVVVVGNHRKFPSALVVPNAEMLWNYAALKGIQAATYEQLLQHPRVVGLLERQVDKYTQDLPQYEKIKRIALLAEELNVDKGELTPTLKVKRRIVEERYKDIIGSLYEEDWTPVVPVSPHGAAR